MENKNKKSEVIYILKTGKLNKLLYCLAKNFKNETLKTMPEN